MAAMSNTYDVTATRERRWWVLDCGRFGSTQARNLTSAPDEAKDLIAVMLEISPVHVVIDLKVHVSDLLDSLVAEARSGVERLQRDQHEVAARSRAAVQGLLAAGLSGADAARVLGISSQRVSQLAHARSAG